MIPVFAIILAAMPPGPHDLWIGVAPTMAGAQLMAKRFHLVAKGHPCGNPPEVRIAHEVFMGVEYFWPKVRTFPNTGASCAKATFSTWVKFNDSLDSNDRGRTIYAYTYSLPQ